MSFTCPSGVINRFEGLMSRWTTLRLRRVGQRLRGLQRVADRFGQGQGPLGFHQLANVYSRDELEDDVVQAAVLAHVVDAGDVVVIEPGRRLGLVLEAQQRIAVGRLVRGEDLQGHRPRQAGIEGAEHAAHPPAPHILHQVKVPQVVAGQDPPLEDAGGRIGHAVGDRLHRHRRPAGDDRHLVIGCGGAAGAAALGRWGGRVGFARFGGQRRRLARWARGGHV